MAFEKHSKDYTCLICQGPFKWFKMMTSDNPCTKEEIDDGPLTEREAMEDGTTNIRTKWHRVCADCELEYRMAVQREHPIGKDDPQWATIARVRQDMKKANKGEQYFARGMHYKAACKLVEQEDGWKDLSKRQKMSRKTQECKNLAEAFCTAIKSGRLFSAFSAANRRFKLGKELDEKVNKLFDEYMADPDNEEKLKALEEIEMEIAQSQDYTTAGGDVKVLKELDHHNDLDKDSGLVVFDLCTRGVATQEVQTTMQAIRPHNR